MQNLHKAHEGRKNEVPGRLPLAQSLCRRQKTAPGGSIAPAGAVVYTGYERVRLPGYVQRVSLTRFKTSLSAQSASASISVIGIRRPPFSERRLHRGTSAQSGPSQVAFPMIPITAAFPDSGGGNHRGRMHSMILRRFLLRRCVSFCIIRWPRIFLLLVNFI